MNLKISSISTQLNVTESSTKIPTTTTKSIWERLPYNVSMEFHILSNAAATSAKVTAPTPAAKRLTAKNYHSINKCCQVEENHTFQQQLQLNCKLNPPQSTPSKEATTKSLQTFTMTNNYCHSETLKVSAVDVSHFSSYSSSNVVDSTKPNEENLLKQSPQQEQEDEKHISNNKFPVDTSDREIAKERSKTTASNVISSKSVVQTKMKRKVTNRTTDTTGAARSSSSTEAAAVIVTSRSCCNEKVKNSNNNSSGDIPQHATVSRTSDNSTTRDNSKKEICKFNIAAKTSQLLLPDLQLVLHRDGCMSSAMRRVVLLMLMLTTATQCWAGRQEALSNCTFPARWEGSWFLSGYQQSIHIKGSQFSYRGKCAASDGNKYLIVDEKGCHRCLVIYEKHKNVLQYKESECEGDSMYLHQTNPSAMAMRSVLKQSGDHSRGGAHPNSNGHSRLSSSDQYIMRSNDDMNDCPSDFCKGRETLQNLCDQIPGDALLYSLFRESAEPVKCPLKGPFVFTYNRGHGECKSPVSNIDSCTEDSRLLLSFQACPDVQGTESTVEELTCLATWKDGNSRYLVGLVSHHHAISNEERYRCFVYEKITSLMGGPSITNAKDAEYKLAQSGDATCNGLDSAEVGSRIMSLRKPPPAERCDFPAWFKGPRHWHALMGNAVYNYHSNDGSMHIIKPNGYMETRALCEQINKQTSTEMMAVVHYTTGCQSGFMCMMFYRRDTHVIEIQTGKQASRLEDACAPDHFDIQRMPYITLLANNPDPQICPLEGLYSLRGAVGPPHISARHKRNHNNKARTGHGHHHLQHDFNAAGLGVDGATVTVTGTGTGLGLESEAGAEMGGGSRMGKAGAGSAFGHKRHNAMSLRHSEASEHSSWHSHTRGLPIRKRRELQTTTTMTTPATAPKSQETFVAADFDDDEGPAAEDNKIKSATMRNIDMAASNKHTSIALKDDDDDDEEKQDNREHAEDDDDDDFEMKGFNEQSPKQTDGKTLLKFHHSNKKNVRSQIGVAEFSNKSNWNRKTTFAAKEPISSESESLPGTEMQQQQPRIFSAISATVARATDGAAADLDAVVNDMINVAVDGLASSSNIDAAGNNAMPATLGKRVAFVATASTTQLQQRSRRDAPGCIVNYKAQRQLWIGCTAPNLIDVRPLCNEDGDEEYSCHGSWAENGTVYIIARHKGSKHGVCISYRPLEGTAAQLIVGDACYRGSTPPAEHPLVANLTAFGKCGDTSSALPSQQLRPTSAAGLSIFLSAIVATLLTQLLSHTSILSLQPSR